MTEIIKFAKPQQELLTQKLQQYFARELNSDLGGFDAQFLLDFIAQEIGREINTMGSKANDHDIQKLVVKMKDELEKIKEQSLNVL